MEGFCQGTYVPSYGRILSGHIYPKLWMDFVRAHISQVMDGFCQDICPKLVKDFVRAHISQVMDGFCQGTYIPSYGWILSGHIYRKLWKDFVRTHMSQVMEGFCQGTYVANIERLISTLSNHVFSRLFYKAKNRTTFIFVFWCWRIS